MDNYKERKEVAEWLNGLGYSFDIDKDGLWMEDYDFTEHKTKDVIDIILAWSALKKPETSESNAILPDVSVNEDHICPKCNGTGLMQRLGGKDFCNNCNATGKLSEVAVCDNCKHKGTSKWLDPCHTCRNGDLKEQAEL